MNFVTTVLFANFSPYWALEVRFSLFHWMEDTVTTEVPVDSVQAIDNTIENLLEFDDDETREEWQERVDNAKPLLLERLSKITNGLCS